MINYKFIITNDLPHRFICNLQFVTFNSVSKEQSYDLLRQLRHHKALC